jgi:hypothetical protein
MLFTGVWRTSFNKAYGFLAPAGFINAASGRWRVYRGEHTQRRRRQASWR